MNTTHNPHNPHKPVYEKPYADGDSPLVDAVIAKIRDDIAIGDITAIDELLRFVPRENLLGFLPEEQWEKYV